MPLNVAPSRRHPTTPGQAGRIYQACLAEVSPVFFAAMAWAFFIEWSRNGWANFAVGYPFGTISRRFAWRAVRCMMWVSDDHDLLAAVNQLSRSWFASSRSATM